MRDPAPSPHLKEVPVVRVTDKVLQHSGQVEVDNDWSFVTHIVEGPARVHAAQRGWQHMVAMERTMVITTPWQSLYRGNQFASEHVAIRSICKMF